ncbi:IS600 ORF2 [Shigella sonnei]|nr:IS600 ORF2 [Shigella sonnei]
MASVSISCPSCSATDGVVRNGKSTAGHQRYLCSHCRKTWQLQFTYTASQPGTHQKIIDMAMNGVFRATTNSNHNLPVAPNLLNQTFAPTAPNQVWVADLTYVATQEGWLYLAGIKDVYTCEIVGYAMGERMTKELTGKALFMALRSQRPPAGLIHHSDRGSQYCAYDYRVIQEQSGLKTSMSRKGNCYDNAPMESFWGTLKNESLSHYRFNNRDEAISVIREYIEIFYNRQRRHSRLGNISPAAFREKYHQMAA